MCNQSRSNLVNALARSSEWSALNSSRDTTSAADELQKELSAGHILFGFVLVPIARRTDDDTILVWINDGTERLAEVHLTWRASLEEPPYPLTQIFDNVDDWIVRATE
jgi:hypothetical protein